ncbi:hypothetical protein OUZ56_022018 [Daphnia magna]|uniref:Uncharacterized protein n=1 Tax=Daphnia magna TaxID=35525 RepID=A0ABR0AV43_9CRUS|nr:hypothetical protein OUZ56_022018 [Daphnia magna]
MIIVAKLARAIQISVRMMTCAIIPSDCDAGMEEAENPLRDHFGKTGHIHQLLLSREHYSPSEPLVTHRYKSAGFAI